MEQRIIIYLYFAGFMYGVCNFLFVYDNDRLKIKLAIRK